VPDPLERPDLWVVARLLEALTEGSNRMKRTPLQMATGVNYTVFTRYLDWMTSRGLVTVTLEGGTTPWVTLTPRGAAAYRYLREGIDHLVGGR
jgi:predicted transcriptional regulator